MKTTYTTKDFYLGAFLMAVGNELQSYEKEGTVTFFQFNDTKNLQQHIKEYFAMTARVNPINYGNALKNMKTLIHAQENENYAKQYDNRK